MQNSYFILILVAEEFLIFGIMHLMNELVPDLKAIIVSPDKDVLILALDYFACSTTSHVANDVVFELLTAKDRRVIPINPLCDFDFFVIKQ